MSGQTRAATSVGGKSPKEVEICSKEKPRLEAEIVMEAEVIMGI